MTREIERGVPFPSGIERVRVQQRFIDMEKLKFAPWKDWKEALTDRFGIVFINRNDEMIEPSEPTVGDLIYEFWKIRRSHQEVGKIRKEEIVDYWERANGLIEGFEDDFNEATTLIVERMPIKKAKGFRR